MQSPFDTLAKGLIDAGLEPWCAVSIQKPVSMDPMYADALVEPRPGAAGALSARGLLGRMAMSPCVIEPFALTPTEVSADRCMARASMLRAARGGRRGAAEVSGHASAAPDGARRDAPTGTGRL